MFLLIHTAFYLEIKLLLVGFILILLGFDFWYQSPCPNITELKGQAKTWSLVMHNGSIEDYDEACILIHNMLFQLILLSGGTKKKKLVFFNDQLSEQQLRLLHLKIALL